MKSKETEEFTKYYQQKKVTGTYDSQREGNDYRKEKRKIELKIFLELIDKKPNENVLELGCSSGFLTQHLGKIIAIDTSEDMLKIAHGKNPLAKCIPADMFEIPFKDESFDKVVTMRVWNHLNKVDLIRAIREAKRVLKKRGYLIFDAEEKNLLRKIVAFFYQKITKITGFRIYQYSLKELKRILYQEGFRIERVKYLKHRIGRQIILKAELIDKKHREKM
ncbi:MAG: methyltransferase domain-containing protein [Candidatus Nanoarchaeia archaeon]|nr:methyltransferase domain-containing protein [Candidatus Nanoarchaeia archaeon]MDD5741433.1 methyltransferase domain-containing protein [Candidatus Nanoarchaeia archaeon]